MVGRGYGANVSVGLNEFCDDFAGEVGVPPFLADVIIGDDITEDTEGRGVDVVTFSMVPEEVHALFFVLVCCGVGVSGYSTTMKVPAEPAFSNSVVGFAVNVAGGVQYSPVPPGAIISTQVAAFRISSNLSERVISVATGRAFPKRGSIASAARAGPIVFKIFMLLR